MSTSLLYHGFGVRGYRYARTDFLEGEVVFTIEQDRDRLRCSACGSDRLICHGGETRLFRSLPIGDRPTHLLFLGPSRRDATRVRPHSPGLHRLRRSARRRYTHAFERYALGLSEHMTIKDVAEHLGIGWDAVKDIQKRHLQKRFTKPKLKQSATVGRRYLRSPSAKDIATSRWCSISKAATKSYFVGDGKGADALDPFWRRLRPSGAKIEAVALDMSKAYILAITENLPEAALVFDQLPCRQTLQRPTQRLSPRTASARPRKDCTRTCSKGRAWLLLKNPENLDPKRRERERLEEALRINKPLAAAYYMKEDLRQIWEQPDKATAALVLADWIRRAPTPYSGIKILHKMAATLEAHRYGILAYYDHRISNGPLEGTNNKIKTMQRQAYGFRDIEFFKLKIYALHQTKYALVG